MRTGSGVGTARRAVTTVTGERETQIVEAFVALARGLADGVESAELLDVLTERCVAILDVAAAGLLLGDGRRHLHVLAASSQSTRDLEVFQIQSDEGPCRDCYRSGTPVSVPDLAEATDRWPRFVPRARSAGFASVHAVPMRLRDDVLGALGLFGSSPGSLQTRDLEVAQALADVATVALLQENATADRAAVTAQLQTALNTRIVLEQAKGVLAYAGGLDVVAAFDALRRYARDHNLRLSAAASAVVARHVSAREVLDHERARARHPGANRSGG